ncbi:hypothetical protein SAMN04487868_107174 [Marinobacter salarius]|jgi:uncharacterized protein|uniref:DUF1853 family protein n=3 Tax=Marinobacteraceae TaxID=2887365 RepID=W5YT42_9GAMM|nr:hypothetical protein AU15_16910 [Marinobacter salarius]SFL71089.1 hypothetical protein SAMN04487868_107174 [Marinobacter salarius]
MRTDTSNRLGYPALMNQGPERLAPHQYHVPAVRHLAWMCRAPQLISSPMGFNPENILPDDTEERLKAWDRAPQHGPEVLTEEPARRLGHYFERLYECLMRDLLGWEILLKNQPVRNNGITLGELDFVVRNPADNVVEHHEIAVKFYLGHLETGQDKPLWYGPNARDRLDIKTRRLTDHQSQLTEKPEARNLLTSLGIDTPARPRIFMPGYLFYHLTNALPSPDNVPPGHLRGHWLYIDNLDAKETTGNEKTTDTKHWVPLIKPHWLGLWRQEEAPDQNQTEDALEEVRSAGIPRLFAALERSEDGDWREMSRVFVVPSEWPGLPRRG